MILEGHYLSSCHIKEVFSCLGWYRRKVTQSYFWWLHHSPKFQECGVVGMSHIIVELDQCCNPRDDCAPPTDVDRWTEQGNVMCCDWWGWRFFKWHQKGFILARDVIQGFAMRIGGIGMVGHVRFIGNGLGGTNLLFNMDSRFGSENLQSNGGGHRELEGQRRNMSRW
jgi:hypothetical protein